MTALGCYDFVSPRFHIEDERDSDDPRGSPGPDETPYPESFPARTTMFSLSALMIHDELAELVASGLSPYEALWGGTYGGALFLEKADEIGSVTSGHRADLLLLDRNPLEDVSAASNPRGVMWHGLWRVDPQMSRAVVGPCSAGGPPDCRRRRTRTVVH